MGGSGAANGGDRMKPADLPPPRHSARRPRIPWAPCRSTATRSRSSRGVASSRSGTSASSVLLLTTSDDKSGGGVVEARPQRELADRLGLNRRSLGGEGRPARPPPRSRPHHLTTRISSSVGARRSASSDYERFASIAGGSESGPPEKARAADPAAPAAPPGGAGVAPPGGAGAAPHSRRGSGRGGAVPARRRRS